MSAYALMITTQWRKCMIRTVRSSMMFVLISMLASGCGASGCGATQPVVAPVVSPIHEAPQVQNTPTLEAPRDLQGGTVEAAAVPTGLAVATFAGGCFWCMEAAFEHLTGVRDAISGYTGGTELHPGYEQVSNHATSHAEAIRVLYDPTVVTYEQLLDLYWRRVDPVHQDRAFSDTGHQYRSAIFVHDAQQRTAAERSRAALVASGRFQQPILTTVENAVVFWVAEEYHQNFWRTTPGRYNEYHENSGRREFLREHWGPEAAY
jgi:methionine-S-sulfoxide reductase